VARVKGVGELRRKLRRLPDDIKDEIGEVFDRAALDLAQAISAAAPRDEGRLAGAAFGQVSRDRLAVHAGYDRDRTGFKRFWKRGGFVSLWQEKGTKHHAAQPFIEPVARRLVPGIVQKVKRAVDSALRKAART